MKLFPFVIAGITVLTSMSTFAQPALSRIKELKNQKRSFVQREAGLSNEDAQIWEELQQSHRKSLGTSAAQQGRFKTDGARLSQTSIESMTEAQADAILMERMSHAEQAVAARKALLDAGRKKLGAKKMLRIQLAEKEWKRELLKKIKSAEATEELD